MAAAIPTAAASRKRIRGSAKLLRVLQDGSFYPADSDQPRHSQARFVVASSGDIHSGVSAGRFCTDLYYRLNMQHVELKAMCHAAMALHRGNRIASRVFRDWIDAHG